MKTITFGAVYGATPIFCHDAQSMGYIELEDLPLSAELRMSLHAWDRLYQNTFVDDYPPDSGFDSVEAEEMFLRQGQSLHEDLRTELGSEYKILYKPLTKARGARSE